MIELIGAAIFAVIAAFFGGKIKGKRDAKRVQEAKDAMDYRDTRRKVEAASRANSGGDDDDNIDWLRARSNGKP